MAASVKLDDVLKARVQHLAGLRQRSPHWIMREAIRQYIDREEAREALGREAEAAWVEFQETGLHITGDELFTWLDTWDGDKDNSPPECHT